MSEDTRQSRRYETVLAVSVQPSDETEFRPVFARNLSQGGPLRRNRDALRRRLQPNHYDRDVG